MGTTRTLATALVVLLGGAASAAAQQPVPSGPLVLEPVNNAFIVAPDVKLTKLDDQTATLVGGYGAWVHDDRLLLGGAGYWRADNNRSHDFGYGGFVAGWIFALDQHFSVTAKGLAGLGRVTTPLTIALGLPSMPMFDDVRVFPDRRFRYRRDFLLAEPEVGVHVKLTRHVGLAGGVSYRVVDLPDQINTLARGASGSVAVQFSIGK